MAEKILLKKYANRRLYDTAQSAYVTLAEVADLIESGKQVKVIDAKSEEDVTAFILSQIIMEKARKKNTLLPVSLLHLIIRYGDNVLEEFFENYLEQTIKNYIVYKSAVDEQFKKWLDLGMDLSDMTQKTIVGLSPFKSVFSNISEEPGKKKK
ncbi:MAG: polyhydroxyalkanoate synthesis regulator DNA-binding domain-containing protein [Desulfobacterales bacterium]